MFFQLAKLCFDVPIFSGDLSADEIMDKFGRGTSFKIQSSFGRGCGIFGLGCFLKFFKSDVNLDILLTSEVELVRCDDGTKNVVEAFSSKVAFFDGTRLVGSRSWWFLVVVIGLRILSHVVERSSGECEGGGIGICW